MILIKSSKALISNARKYNFHTFKISWKVKRNSLSFPQNNISETIFPSVLTGIPAGNEWKRKLCFLNNQIFPSTFPHRDPSNAKTFPGLSHLASAAYRTKINCKPPSVINFLFPDSIYFTRISGAQKHSSGIKHWQNSSCIKYGFLALSRRQLRTLTRAVPWRIQLAGLMLSPCKCEQIHIHEWKNCKLLSEIHSWLSKQIEYHTWLHKHCHVHTYICIISIHANLCKLWIFFYLLLMYKAWE